MSDWRGDDSSRKKEKPKRKSMPVFPRRDGPSEAKAEPRDWTGKPIASPPKTAGPQRSWTVESKSESPVSRISWRKTFLWLLTPAVAFATISFVYYITKDKDRKIPLLMIVAKDRQPSEFGELGTSDSYDSTSVTSILRPNSQLLVEMRDNGPNWLKELNDQEGFRKYLKSESDRTFLQAGGKGNQFIAFYVRCFVVRKENELNLVIGSDDPTFPLECDSGNPSSRPLLLKDAFRRFAQATPSNCFAIVGLDVRPPSAIVNLGDMRFPFDDFKRAFDSLDQEEKNKLVLFLPCGQGEESWAVPKTGMTVFGATFLTGLTEMFGDQDLSLEDFSQRMEANVTGWVSQKRDSQQIPKPIYDPDTWTKIKGKPFLGFFTASPTPPGSKAQSSPIDWEHLYEELNGLWQRYHSVWKDRNRLEPHQHWVLASLESHLLLMEDNVEYDPDPETWDSMVRSAEKRLDRLKSPSHRYGVSRIEDELSNDGNQKERYLEDKLHEILEKEIDPKNRGAEETETGRLARETLKSLLDRWSKIQSLAARPRRELSWWMDEPIRKLDVEFLKAVDEFIANDWEGAKKSLKSADESIGKVEKGLERIEECMSFRDEAASFIPHAMAFLMRTNRFSESDEDKQTDTTATEIVTVTELVADIAAALDQMEALLREPNFDQIGLDASDSNKKLQEAKEKILKRVQVWLEDEGEDPKTIRNLRIAVRYPYLSAADRVKSHNKLASVFKKEEASGKVSSSSNNRLDGEQVEVFAEAGEKIEKVFLKRLQETSSENLEYWKTILRGDLRSSKYWKIDFLPLPSSYSQLYEHVGRMRRIASALGMHSVSQPDKPSATCAEKILDSYTALNELHYRSMQRERLLLARWGSPEVDVARVARDGGAFVFEELAKKYSDSTPQLRDHILRDPDWNFVLEKEKGLEKRFDAVSASLKQMSDYLSAEIDGSSRIRVKWATPQTFHSDENPWDGIQPAVKISDVVPETASVFSLLGPVNRLFDNTTDQDLNAGKTDVTVNFRGHRIRSGVLSDQILFATGFQSPSESKITATIKNEKRSVVILLDCSGSMSKGDRMKNAKQSVKSLVEIFRNCVRAGQEIDVSLVAFGVFSPEPELAKHGFSPSESGKQYLGYILGANGARYSHIAHTPFKSIKADESTKRQWEGFLSAPFVDPGLNTPLYDAMDFACEVLSGRPGGTRELVILSDGGNELSSEFSVAELVKAVAKKDSYVLKELPEASPNSAKFIYNGPKRDCGAAIDQVINKGVNLHFYQVEGVESNSDAKKEAELFVYKLKDLKDKKLLMTRTEESFTDFIEIDKRIQADFALPEINVHYRNPPLGKDVTVSFLEPEPTAIRPVAIELKVLKNQSEELTREPVNIEAFGGQRIRIEFDAKARELIFKSSRDLKEDNPFESTLVSKRNLDGVDSSSKYIMKWNFGKNRLRENAFLLQIDLRREQERKPTKYLPWPRFAVAKFMQQGPDDEVDSSRKTMLISDLDFMPRHYPTLEFRIENLMDKSWEASGGSLDLWWSFASEEQIFGTLEGIRKVVAKEDGLEFRDCRVKRDGKEIRVDVERQAGRNKYQWIRCPSAKTVNREYRGRADKSDRWTEIHRFTLPDEDVAKDVDMFIFSDDDLSKLSEESASSDSPLYWYSGTRESKSQ